MNNDRFVVDSLRLHLTVVNFCLMSVIRKEKLNNIITASTNQSSRLRSGQTFRHQYGISFVEAQTIPVFALPKYNFFTQYLRKHDHDTTMVSR